MHCDQFFSTCDLYGFHFDRSNFSARISLARSHGFGSSWYGSPETDTYSEPDPPSQSPLPALDPVSGMPPVMAIKTGPGTHHPLVRAEREVPCRSQILKCKFVAWGQNP